MSSVPIKGSIPSKVTDGTVEVVSEGHWKLFTPSPEASESGS
jgi:hypothetical protein